MDLLRKFMNGGDGHSQAVGNIERLLEQMQQERQALDRLHVSFETHATGIPQVNAKLDDSERRAEALAQRLDALSARVADFEGIRQQSDGLQARVGTLEASMQEAEERVEQTLAREAQVQQHRDAMEQLVSLGRSTLGQIDVLKRESASLAQLEARLPGLRTEFQPLFDQHAALKTVLDALRGGIAALAQDAETGRDASLKARTHATKANELVADVQRRLEPLSDLRALSQDTDAQLRRLNGLAEHVSAKVKALESQQSVVDHALVESRRVQQMVWEMEVQINKLDEGSRRATQAEETLAKLERVCAETTARFEDAARARESFGRDVAQQEHDARGLIEVVQRHLDQLG
jgi:chromosome segregation ATPase